MIDHAILARQVAAVRDDVASHHIEDLLRFCDVLADAAVDGADKS